MQSDKSADIRAYWTAAAAHESDGDGLRPTARDPHLQDAVEAAMVRRLRSADRVLDIGCGDGVSTLRFARHAGQIVGVDYIEAFVEKAARRARGAGASNTGFEAASVLDLAGVRARHQPFDVAITIRCLINLSSAAEQETAIAEIASCVKPGGLYLASEGWAEGMDGLNLLRRRAGLPSIEVVKYNLLLRRSEFERAASDHFEIVDYIGLGFFLMMSRVVQPLLVAPEAPSHTHKLNQIAARLEQQCLFGNEFQSCDYAGVYVLRRKS
jgi:SAM-dependent methyltransferase